MYIFFLLHICLGFSFPLRFMNGMQSENKMDIFICIHWKSKIINRMYGWYLCDVSRLLINAWSVPWKEGGYFGGSKLQVGGLRTGRLLFVNSFRNVYLACSLKCQQSNIFYISKKVAKILEHLPILPVCLAAIINPSPVKVIFLPFPYK